MRTLTCIALVLSLPALSGCGFTPLYATDGPTAVAKELSSVQIADLEGPANAGRYFQRALSDNLASNAATATRYQLAVELKEQRRAIAVTVSANTRRFDYYLYGTYILTDTLKNETRKKRLDAVVSYGVVESQYASLVGREDAERRAAEELARKMELDIALFLKGRAPKNTGIVLPDVFDEELIEGGIPEKRATDTE